ncbi:MAG TPA: hypothetical protein VG368_01625, partial [Acidimicrobiales bacterium]|nr:hypothetical protein [Acidimicrobiales bacterium]
MPVLGVIVFNLFQLWPETSVVSYPDDSAMHAEMVRFAVQQLQAGHLPLNGWFPFLNVGSPVFLHYQSLPAMLTAVAGLAIGGNHAFAWSCYLLVSLWPISVFISARLFRLPVWGASAAACTAPFIVSVPGLGYEQASYLWIGFGLWTQLWAMFTLPLAWGYSWRAVTEGRSLLPAVLFVTLTMCLHFMSGYLAVIAPIAYLVVSPRQFRERWWRAVVVVVGSFGAAAWVIVPLVRSGHYASINEFLQHTSHADSFGARRVLSWLVEGDLFDAHRLPVVSVLVGVGLVACFLRFRQDELTRALLLLFGIGLVLFFGRPTLGPVLDLLPGSTDLFLRRFVVAVQLGGMFLAGVGAVAVARGVRLVVQRVRPSLLRLGSRRRDLLVRRGMALLAAALVLVPLMVQLGGYDASNRRDIAYQLRADRVQGHAVDELVERLHQLPPGRVYAGLPFDNWGAHFLVGYTTVLQYLASKGVDEIGFTLRTSSLMSNPEAYFDESSLGDFRTFGVRYLIYPLGRQPGVRAAFVMRRGDYVLWSVPHVSYAQVVDTLPSIALDRGDIGSETAWWLHS